MRKVGRGNWQWWQVAIGIGPLLALAGVAGADFARVKRVEQASHVMQLAGRIAHALQRMRGLTVGAALDANFSLDALPVQRRSVDDGALARLRIGTANTDADLRPLLSTGEIYIASALEKRTAWALRIGGGAYVTSADGRFSAKQKAAR